jgi:Type VI secretion system/phage-baseplate injector OB domain
MPVALSGLYRAIVVDNADPERLGRVKVAVPSVMGAGQAAWAMPCVPYGGVRQRKPVPAAGTPVWVAFEGGDIAKPVWLGRFWSR